MQLVRARLTGKPLFRELHSQLAKMVREIKIMPKKTPVRSKFIADSSPTGNNAVKHGHPCASEKDKPVARRGRKA